MGKKQLPKPSKSTADQLLSVLREGRLAQIRHRKSAIQLEYMIARKTVQNTYAEFSAEDLPVDLQRLRRDLEIWRDQQIADAIEEIDKAYLTTEAVIMSVADSHPALYQASSKDKGEGKGTPADTPEKIARHLSALDMKRISEAILAEAEGLTLFNICDRLELTSPPVHMAAKRFLGWLRSGGHVKTQGPGGKGMRYCATRTLRKIVERLSPPEE